MKKKINLYLLKAKFLTKNIRVQTVESIAQCGKYSSIIGWRMGLWRRWVWSRSVQLMLVRWGWNWTIRTIEWWRILSLFQKTKGIKNIKLPIKLKVHSKPKPKNWKIFQVNCQICQKIKFCLKFSLFWSIKAYGKCLWRHLIGWENYSSVFTILRFLDFITWLKWDMAFIYVYNPSPKGTKCTKVLPNPWYLILRKLTFDVCSVTFSRVGCCSTTINSISLGVYPSAYTLKDILI